MILNLSAVAFSNNDLSNGIRIPREMTPDLAYLLDFGKFSTVYVLGNPWHIKNENTDLLGMTAHNIICLERAMPEQTNPAQAGDVSVKVPEGGTFDDFNNIQDKAFGGD